MALANYTDLQAAIADWLDRTDLTARIPDFVRMVEAEVQTQLDDPAQYTSAPLTLVAGNAALPADFGALISIADSTIGRIEQVSASQFADFQSSSGFPRVFAVTANQFSVLPAGPGTVTVLYRKGIPALASNATNWLLTRMPNLYLYGSLMHAEFFAWNDERLPTIKAKYDELLAQLLIDGERRKFGSAPLAPRIGRR